MIEYKLLPRPVTLEASIPLKSDAPDEVVSEYRNRFGGKLVVWKNAESMICGCIHNNRSVVAPLKELGNVCVYEMKPAKSTGWVGMCLKTHSGEDVVTLFDSRHSDLSMKWLLATQEKVASFLSLGSTFQDLGYDT